MNQPLQRSHSKWRRSVLKFMLAVGLLSLCNGCQMVGDYMFRPKYDYMVVFYSQNSYDLKNVGFSSGKSYFGCGWLSSCQLKVGSFLPYPLTKDVFCEWEKDGEIHKKQFHLPQSVKKKFQGTIVFFFDHDDVIMEYETYSDPIKIGSLARKYTQMYHDHREHPK